NTLTLSPSSGDSGSTTSTTDASVANPTHPCPIIGLSQNDQQACGSSKAQQTQTLSAALQSNDGANLGSLTLVSLGASPSAGSSFVNRDLQANVDGLIHSDVSRALGTLTIGGFPSKMNSGGFPAGWQGYLVQLTSFTD